MRCVHCEKHDHTRDRQLARRTSFRASPPACISRVSHVYLACISQTGKNSGKDVPYDEAPFRTLQSFSTKFSNSVVMQAWMAPLPGRVGPHLW